MKLLKKDIAMMKTVLRERETVETAAAQKVNKEGVNA
jgi:hypothetical protein